MDKLNPGSVIKRKGDARTQGVKDIVEGTTDCKDLGGGRELHLHLRSSNWKHQLLNMGKHQK